MKELTYYVHSNSPYIIPSHMVLCELPMALHKMEELARKAMTESNSEHAIYAVKKYSSGDEIERVDFYNPPVCLNDADFYERTEAEAKNQSCMIYAVHARK